MDNKQILDMKTQRASLIKKSREAYDALMESKSAEDKRKYENIENEIADLEEKIAEGEKHLAREEELSEHITENVEPKQEQAKEKIIESDEYKNLFEQYVKEGKVTETNLPLTEAVVNGSYIVPQDYENKIREKKYNLSVIRRLADVMTVSHDRNVPMEGTLGSSAWIDKDGAYPDNDLGFATHLFQPHKVGRIIPIAEEILMDTEINLEDYIAKKFGQSNGVAEEAAFFSGSGTGEPTGLLDTATVGKTAAAVDSLTYDELLDLFYAVSQAYAQNGAWVMNRNTLKAIRQLKDGSGNWLFQPGSQVDTIEGKPVFTSENMPGMATGNKAVAFGDFSSYQIVDRSGFNMQRLNETYAANGQVGFKGFSRTDGFLLFADAVQTLQMA